MLTTEVTEHLTMFTTFESTLPQSPTTDGVILREGSNSLAIAVGVSVGVAVLILLVAFVIVMVIAFSSRHFKQVATDTPMQVQHTYGHIQGCI